MRCLHNGFTMLTYADIQAAAQRLNGAVLQTPCVESRTLSQITGAQVYLKFENLQFTASFKERGALNKLLIARQQLSNLITYMDGKSGAEELIAKVLNDPALLQSLAAAPKPQGESGG